MERLLDTRNAIVLIGLLTLWRLYLSAELQLHPDEAYYWLWSRHLDVAYYDHPPMVAYFIWLTTRIFNSELWVRFSGVLVTLLTTALIWQLAMQLFRNARIAAGSALLFNVYPLTMLGLLVITPDVPVFLFGALSVHLFYQAAHGRKIWHWYALGLVFGLALLSKYTAILLAPCFLLYLGLTEGRRWLRTVHPYLALLVGLLCFAPVVYWNRQHDWLSFAFQLGHGLGGDRYSLAKVAEYIGGQMFLTGPITWLVGIHATIVGFQQREKNSLLLIASSIPVIAFFGLTSFKTVAGPNWPMFAYFSFCILVAHFCLADASRMRRVVWTSALVSSLLISASITLHARFNLLPLERISPDLTAADATNWFHGWRELGAEVRKYPNHPLVITPSHQLSAQISYYTGGNLAVQTDRAARPSQFNLWHVEPHGPERLFLWSGDDAHPPFTDFVATSSVSTLDAYRDGAVVRRYHLVKGRQHSPASTD